MVDSAPCAVSSSFSQLQLHLSKIKEPSSSTTYGYELGALCKFKEDMFQGSGDNIKALLSFDPRIGWNVGKDLSEEETFYYILKNLIFPLSKRVIVESKYYKRFLWDGHSEQVTNAYLGIGDKKLWHGRPDARAVGWGKGDLNLVQMCGSQDESGEDESDDDSEDERDDDSEDWAKSVHGNSVTIDGKRGLTSKGLGKHLSQLASTSIVSSFTENGICGEDGLNTMIPAIMINGNHFLIVMYDSVGDWLMVSEEIEYAEDGKLLPFAVLALFIFMNHRYDIVSRILCAYK